jgi:hypothetical protein
MTNSRKRMPPIVALVGEVGSPARAIETVNFTSDSFLLALRKSLKCPKCHACPIARTSLCAGEGASVSHSLAASPLGFLRPRVLKSGRLPSTSQLLPFFLPPQHHSRVVPSGARIGPACRASLRAGPPELQAADPRFGTLHGKTPTACKARSRSPVWSPANCVLLAAHSIAIRMSNASNARRGCHTSPSRISVWHQRRSTMI